MRSRWFASRAAVSLAAICASAELIHLTSEIALAGSLAIAAFCGVVVATWLAIGGVGAPGGGGTPTVSGGGLAGNATQGMMVAQQEMFLQQHMQYIRRPRDPVELMEAQLPPAERRSPSWARPVVAASLAAGMLAVVAALVR